MLGKAVDLFFNPIVQMVLLAIAGVAIRGFMKYKNLYKELTDIPKKVIEARKEKSPGGAKITQEEWAAIGKETVEAIEAAAKIDWKSFFKKGK